MARPWDFNPRSHEGSDTASKHNDIDTNDFNPRSHEGSDTASKHNDIDTNDFNPRSHEGSDSCRIGAVDCMSMISIHAPTRGAT